MSQNDKYFNMRNAYECFKSTLLAEHDIHIEYYLKGYEELRKFCILLGSVFSFVASEINEKAQIMYELRLKSEENFSTLKKMIEYEKENNLLSDKTYVSGCRTLLRLHRGLDFIRTFLRRLSVLEMEHSTGSVGCHAYGDTLANFHGWFLRQGTYLAMNFLPTKRILLDNVCGSEERIADTQDVLPLMLEVTDEIYSRTENYFRMNDLLELP